MSDRLVTDQTQALRCASACEEFANGMQSIAYSVTLMDMSGGFGTLPSGIALAQKYSNLTHRPEGSLASMLAAHITVATNLREAFVAAGRGYDATEEASASHITATEPR